MVLNGVYGSIDIEYIELKPVEGTQQGHSCEYAKLCQVTINLSQFTTLYAPRQRTRERFSRTP